DRLLPLPALPRGAREIRVVLNAVQVAQPRLRQAMGARAVTQQGHVAEGWNAVGWQPARHVGDGADNVAIQVLGRGDFVAIIPARTALSGLEPKQVPSRDPIQHAPQFTVRVRTDVRWRRLPFRTAFQIEPQAIAADSRDAPFDRSHAPPFTKRTVVHVGTVGE